VNDEPHTICPTCREAIDPDGPGVVVAVEQVDVTGQMVVAGRETADGMKAAFHEGCFDPADPRYRRLDG